MFSCNRYFIKGKGTGYLVYTLQKNKYQVILSWNPPAPQEAEDARSLRSTEFTQREPVSKLEMPKFQRHRYFGHRPTSILCDMLLCQNCIFLEATLKDTTRKK